jgi:hypothetical protein
MLAKNFRDLKLSNLPACSRNSRIRRANSVHHRSNGVMGNIHRVMQAILATLNADSPPHPDR